MTGVDPTSDRDSRFVLQGFADLGAWRSDMRVFNPTGSPIKATLTYRAQGTPADTKSVPVTLAAGETKVLDDVLRSTFGITNSGGAIEIDLASPNTVVATTRTYNKTSTGTYGQFIPAVVPSAARGRSDGALSPVQIEDSPAMRNQRRDH